MEDESEKNEPKVQADNNSVAIGRISIGGDLSGQVNIVHAEKGSTVIIGTSAEAVGGFAALRELMERSPDVRTAVIVFQTDFRVAHEQLDLLGHYKDLHDLLHHLQLHCYNGIAQAETRFPSDQMTIDNLTEYAQTLEEIVDDLRRTSTRTSLPKHELGWIDDLSLAKADLLNAIDLRDEKLLKKVKWRLNRILSTQPARINLLLNHCARDLRLPTLLSALAIICETLASLHLDARRVAAFQSGVDALSAMDQQLSSLVENHDRWQALDVELRLIEASLDHGLLDLEMSWPEVKLKAEPLYTAHSDEWANALKRDDSALEEALSAGNPAKVRGSFHRYHRLVIHRFFQVDIDLKSLCGHLQKIGVPLSSVLELIQ